MQIQTYTRSFICTLSLVLLLTLTGIGAAQAQSDDSGFKIGPRATLALGDISDFGGDFAVGADVRYGLSGLPVEISGSFDYYFVENQTKPLGVSGQTVEVNTALFTVDLNGLYNVEVEGGFSPYVGAGLGIVGAVISNTSDTDIGANVVAGSEYGSGTFRPFLQGQASFGGDFTRLGITGGVLFAL